MNPYILLVLSVLGEVVALTALRYVVGLTKPLPIIVVVVAYALSFWGLYIVLKTLPVGITYAIWAGLGTVGTILAGIVLFKEKPDSMAWLGIALIVGGVMVINLLSKSSTA